MRDKVLRNRILMLIVFGVCMAAGYYSAELLGLPPG